MRTFMTFICCRYGCPPLQEHREQEAGAIAQAASTPVEQPPAQQAMQAASVEQGQLFQGQIPADAAGAHGASSADRNSCK